MPGHTAHPPRRRVVHRAAQQVIDVGILVRLRPALLIPSRRRDPRQQTGVPCARSTTDRCALSRRRSPCERRPSHPVRTARLGRGQISGVRQAQRPKDVALHVIVFGFARQLLDQQAQQDEVDVGIPDTRTRRRLQRRRQRTTKAFRPVDLRQSPRILEVHVARQARRVRQQHPQRHLCTQRIVRSVEVRQVLLHGIVERKLALLEQLHDRGRRRERLRQRRDVEDGVLGHRLRGGGHRIQPRLPVELAFAVRLAEDDLAAVPDLHHGAGQFVGRDRIVDQRGDRGEVIGRRRDGRKRRRGRRRWRDGSRRRLRTLGLGRLRRVATRARRRDHQQDRADRDSLQSRSLAPHSGHLVIV